MRRRIALGLQILVTLVGASACYSYPPAVTGITVFPCDAEGRPLGDAVSRTRRRPPIPVLGVRPGADPWQSSMFLNEPSSGEVAITLARGLQNFLLYTATIEPADHYVIAVYLDHEPTPALSTIVGGGVPRPVAANHAPLIMGLEGEPVANTSSLSVSRNGYRVSLRRAAFPLRNARVDTVSLWSLRPDDIVDTVGVISVEVEGLAAGAPQRQNPLP